MSNPFNKKAEKVKRSKKCHNPFTSNPPNPFSVPPTSNIFQNSPDIENNDPYANTPQNVFRANPVNLIPSEPFPPSQNPFSSQDPFVVPSPAPSLKIKWNNRVKKVSKIPGNFEKFDSLVRKKYDEFSEGKDTYHVCYLDNEQDQIDISDDEDYSVFLDHVKTSHEPSVKVFLNSKASGREFDKEIDDCETVHESYLGDTVLGASLERSTTMPPPNFDFSKIEEYKKEIEMLKFEVEKTKMKEELRREQEKAAVTQKALEKELKKGLKKNKNKKSKAKGKGKKKAGKKKKIDSNAEEESSKKLLNPNEDLIDIKEPEAQISIEMEYKSIDSESSGDEMRCKKVESDPEEDYNPTKRPKTSKIFDSENEDAPPKLSEEEDYNPKTSESPRKNESFELLEERPREFSDSKHEYAIQPVLKEDSCEKIQEKVLCQVCQRDLTEETKYICSIRDNYTLCEVCEMKRNDGYVFIKIPKGVEFSLGVYDKFCQKMLGIYDVPAFHGKHQKAVMNPCYQKENVRVSSMLMKRAQILDKQKYKNGVAFESGGLIKLSWNVKNMTNQPWSDNMILVCYGDSDIILDEQRIDLKLKSNEKGYVNVEFLMPKDTPEKEHLKLKMYLYDLEEQKAIGDSFIVKLHQFDILN